MSIRKKCPNLKCQEPLVAFPSMNVRICSGCNAYYDWSLKVGQKSIYIQGLIGAENDKKNQKI